MEHLTEGATRLGAVVAKTSQAAVAERVEVTQQAVSDWVRGKSIPRGQNLLRIQREYGIDPTLWLQAVDAAVPARDSQTAVG